MESYYSNIQDGQVIQMVLSIPREHNPDDNGSVTDPLCVINGIPQGNILGPFFYIIGMNDAYQIVLLICM